MIGAAPAPRGSEHSRYAWRGALVACGLNAIGMPLDILVSRGIPDMPRYPVLVSSAAGALLAVVLIARRRDPTIRLSSAIFILNNAVIIWALWITAGVYATAPERWIPFQANKLGTLAAAVLAPGLATGIATIAGYAGMAIVRYLTLPADLQHRLPTGEPWVIVIHFVFASAMLVYRVHSISLARRVLRMRTEAIATQRLARAFLALRDFTNTPLQTIELATALARRRCAEVTPLFDRIQRSLDRLFRLNHAFTAYDAQVEWTDEDTSPDLTAIVSEASRVTPFDGRGRSDA
jgi:hypothetical protein